MPVIEETVIITRPVREVFDFLMLAENQPRWDSSMLECAQVGSAPPERQSRTASPGRRGLHGVPSC